MQYKRKCLVLILLVLNCFTDGFSQKLVEQTSKTIKINKQKFIKIIGYIEVPEDRENPNGMILKLPVHIIKTKNQNPQEPIFWLDGGPGHSNIMESTYTEFLENHDFVMVGYRGADGNSTFKSKKVSKAIKGLNHQIFSDESMDNSNAKVKEFAEELKEKGFDIRKYTMLDVIDDIEYTRKALEIPKINLYSVSYGTRMALLYSYKYPNSINRSVMVGANPPGHFMLFADKTEQILNKYDSLYKVQYPGVSIKEAMKKTFANMPKRWSFYKLDADKIKVGTFLFIFEVDNAAMVFDTYFKAANKGDYSGLYLIQSLFDVAMSKNNLWGDMLSKGLSADFEPNKNYRSDLRKYDKTTILGPNISLLLWGLADGWNPALIPEEYRKVRKSDTQTLIVSGNMDNSTPTDFATEKLLPNLINGHQVILKDYSHNMIDNYQQEQIKAMIAHYFKTGEVDESQIKYQPINFKPKKSLNKMAKLGYPIWVVLNWIY
jgi:pimeloyl-ACP methyl ester carboxylesterase